MNEANKLGKEKKKNRKNPSLSKEEIIFLTKKW